MSSVTDITTLKINYLTQAQYEQAISGGTVNPNELYLTPSSGTGVSDVEVDGESVVTGGVAEVDLTGKSDVGHTHTKSDITDFPTDVSDFTNDAGYLTSYTETDPTVPSWAKASTKPTYTYSEVGAASSSHTHGNITDGGDITATAPTIATGDQIIINDNSASKVTNGPTFDGSTTTKALTPKGTWESFLQSYTETDPTVPSWAKQSSKPTYTAAEVGAVPTSRTVNDKALSSDITLSASDVSALPITGGTITGDLTITNLTELGLDTSASSGTIDGDLYAAIVALNWQSTVID